jgi:hypothetical protein
LKDAKSSTAAVAVEEEKIILSTINLTNENVESFCIDTGDAIYKVPIDENLVYLENKFEESDD